MRILYLTTQGSTMEFFTDFVKTLLNEGHVVDIATNEQLTFVPECYRDWNCTIYQIPCVRNPLNINNIRAIRKIRKIAKQYDIVHCHTPIAAACTRIACTSLRNKGLKVYYTAHGFHFYKGAPLLNWLLYYPIERLCSRYTDVLITINHEDYLLAKRRFKKTHTEYIPGVGIDIEKFKNTVTNKSLKRKELGVPEDAILLVSVGELNDNKNHQIIIKALAKLNVSNLHYVIAGRGNNQMYLAKMADELAVKQQVHLIGYRNDVAEIYKASDICCFPSIREGLGLAAIEAMACGLPVVAASNRGTKEFSQEGKTGFLVDYDDVSGFVKAINRLILDEELRRKMGEMGQSIVKSFDVSVVNQKMKKIYFGQNQIEFSPKVSIIIPVYNGSDYMREAIDSALNQTYKNFEVIVINDGSTDGGKTEQIVKEYGDRIRYFCKENGGVSTALNAGICNMKGEYFSWLSHDDMYTPDKLEKSIQALAECNNRKTIICCQSVHMDKHSQILPGQKAKNADGERHLYTWDDALVYLEKHGSMNGCSLLIHKDILLECGLFDESLRFNQDGFMWNKIFLRRYPILMIPEVCVKNRIHEKQLTQTGQDIFHRDCEKMSEYLIPELIEVSNSNKNIIVEYIKYNAKYDNQNVVRNAYQKAMEKKLISIRSRFEINAWRSYGKIRPYIRRIYYRLFRKM